MSQPNRRPSLALPFNPRALYFAAFVLLAIFSLTIFSRLWMVDAPNFKPVAALALFGGFYFRKVLPVMFAVVGGMLLGDLILGFYEWPLAVAVYGSLLVAGVLGVFVQPKESISNRVGLATFARFGIASLTMSVIFFLTTNFACWALGWYPPTASGLLDCYIAAIPFFRSTLLSDLIFSQAFLGAYAMALVCLQQQSPVAATE